MWVRREDCRRWSPRERGGSAPGVPQRSQGGGGTIASQVESRSLWRILDRAAYSIDPLCGLYPTIALSAACRQTGEGKSGKEVDAVSWCGVV